MEYYTYKEALERLQCNPSLLNRLAKRGEIRRVNLPGRTRKGVYIKEDVEKYVQMFAEYEKIYVHAQASGE